MRPWPGKKRQNTETSLRLFGAFLRRNGFGLRVGVMGFGFNAWAPWCLAFGLGILDVFVFVVGFG